MSTLSFVIMVLGRKERRGREEDDELEGGKEGKERQGWGKEEGRKGS